MDSKHTFWESHVEAWQTGGQTQRAYCREHGLSLASFGYWRRKLRADTVVPAKGMIPIVAPSAGANVALEIALSNRLTIRVPLSAEPTRVVAWIQVLGAC